MIGVVYALFTMTNTKMTVELYDELRTALRRAECKCGCDLASRGRGDVWICAACEGYQLVPNFGAPIEEEDFDPRTCNLCDGVGHGYPGAGPCQLENTMSFEDVAREEWEATYLS